MKIERHGTHAAFLDFGITIKDDKLIYKIDDKRNKVPFFIVKREYRSSSVPSSRIYGSFYSKILSICRIKFKNVPEISYGFN